MPRRNTIPVQTYGPKKASLFEKVKPYQPAKFSRVLTFSACSDVAQK